MRWIILFTCLFVCIICFAVTIVHADDLKVGDSAPLFEAKNEHGDSFTLESRRDKGWTVLYFYPKAETPGCTKEACTFSDAVEKIRVLGAEVYGISADTVAEQAEFHKHHNLKFDLLADPDAEVIIKYGAKMPILAMAKRWTFIIDPKLKIRSIQRGVDPVKDADRVAAELVELKKE